MPKVTMNKFCLLLSRLLKSKVSPSVVWFSFSNMLLRPKL